MTVFNTRSVSRLRSCDLSSFCLQRISAVLLCISLAACSPAPDYTTANGDSGRFADHHGKWLVINYWAIWCKPCREEIPELNTFQQQNTDKVVVMGVDFDQNPTDKLQTLIKELDIRFTVLTADPASVFGWGRAKGLPVTYIIDPQGKLVATLNGPQTLDSLNKAITTKP